MKLFRLLLLLGVAPVMAQEIPLGTWRFHPSFYSISALAGDGHQIYAAAGSSLAIIDTRSSTLHVLTRQSGLPGSTITALALANETLVAGYSDGVVSIGDDLPTLLFPAQNLDPAIDRQINAISLANNLAYLATAYGVVVVDPAIARVKETWRDLGNGGQRIEVTGVVFRGDSVFIGTSEGIKGALAQANLLDYNSWNPVGPQTPTKFLSSSGDALISVSENGTVMVSSQSTTGWESLALDALQITAVAPATNGFWLGYGQKAYLWTQAGLNLVPQPGITTIQALLEVGGELWIGDRVRGVVNGTQQFRPTGPANNETRRLELGADKIYQLSAADSIVAEFAKGTWINTLTPASYLTDLAYYKNSIYISSASKGLLDFTTGSTIVGPFQSSAGKINLTALATDESSLWVANAGTVLAIHRLTDNQWDSYPVSGLPAAFQFPIDIAAPGNGRLWLRTSDANGIAHLGNEGEFHLKTTLAGSGALPSLQVNCMALDKNGDLWLGTDKGVAYFFDPEQDAVRPIFDNRFLLKDENVLAIAIDAGNRKWFGTANGLWLFDATGENLLAHFTANNSPLPDNRVSHLVIQPQTGEVFIGNELQLVSFRSDAVETAVSENLRVFPNPVEPGYAGLISIQGTHENALVRVTDITGGLVREWSASGNGSSWDLKDLRGKRVPAGIYLVFSLDAQGKKTGLGKMIIR